MTRIKICGLTRPCDVDYVNTYLPDYCGFVINVPRSRRNVTPQRARELAARLKRGIVPVSLYYLLWQFKARKTLDSLHLNADIIHHVTFNSFVCPGVWWNRREKVVLGPLGGMSICAPVFLA